MGKYSLLFSQSRYSLSAEEKLSLAMEANNVYPFTRVSAISTTYVFETYMTRDDSFGNEEDSSRLVRCDGCVSVRTYRIHFNAGQQYI